MTYMYITCTTDKKALCVWLTTDVKKAMKEFKEIPQLFIDTSEFGRRVIYAESHDNYELMKSRFDEINRMQLVERWDMINAVNSDLWDMSNEMA